MRSSLIILTRNEIKGLTSLIGHILRNKVDESFAVDYQSSDGTVEFFKKNHYPVIHQTKSGRAEAFRVGVKHAKGKYLIFFSPDGNENPADIPLLIKELNKGADLVIASRFLPNARNEEDGKRFKFRKWANQFFTFVANIVWHGNLTDSINGYRAIRKNIFNRLNLDAEGFAIEYQMTIRALKLGIKIKEIPTREGERIGGKSGSSGIPTGFRFVYYLLREMVIGKRFGTDNI